jgi:hypothetical protein
VAASNRCIEIQQLKYNEWRRGRSEALLHIKRPPHRRKPIFICSNFKVARNG